MPAAWAQTAQPRASGFETVLLCLQQKNPYRSRNGRSAAPNYLEGILSEYEHSRPVLGQLLVHDLEAALNQVHYPFTLPAVAIKPHDEYSSLF